MQVEQLVGLSIAIDLELGREECRRSPLPTRGHGRGKIEEAIAPATAINP
jgi:hypothetical protein